MAVNTSATLMLLADVLIRYSAITLLLLLTVLTIKDGGKSPPARYAALVTITVAAMLLSTAQPELQLPKIVFVIAHSFDSPSTVFIWWLGLSILKDDFSLGPLHWAVLLIHTSLALYFRLPEFGITVPFPLGLPLIYKSIIFAMMGHLIYVALKGRSDDLIEKRRTLRLYFVYGLSVATALIIVAETLLYPKYNAGLTIFRASIILAITSWAFFWLVSFHPEKLSFAPAKAPTLKPTGLDPRDEALHKRLIEEMDERKIYLEPELTIRTLADRLKTPEHRLRVLINQGLGQRNFSAFLNTYRIEAVKQAFADPENARIPVLTIALDAGYGSLAPFNRAFLKAESMTPSAYRQNLLTKPNQ